ncbi:hypothetical protein ABTX85_34670 [Streptomyces sp. NPDC096097]|uniref:hypothetical protein n=1 Tax=Streptomyces sp. NPDC096097 TaxID=3155546 RepID=UPI00332EB2E4
MAVAVGAAGAATVTTATVTTAGAATAARCTLLGARAGASWAVRMRMRTATLYRVLAVLMVCMAVALVASHTAYLEGLGLEGPVRVADGQAAQANGNARQAGEDLKDTLRRH